MSSHSPFVYEQLPEDGQSIRLIKVSSKSALQELVQCQLTHATVKDDYTALSYTWGPATPKKQILVNDKLMEIGRNLWEFLKRVSLSPDYAETKFWIDAVCINQEDDHEKSYQVAAMGSIYESASDVLIWLSPSDGSHDNDTDITLLPIRKFEPMSQLWHEDEITHQDPTYQAPATCSTYVSNRYTLEAISQHSYWNRLWIVQEFLLHKERTIVYGPCAIPGKIFAAFRMHHEVTKRRRRQMLNEVSTLTLLTRPLDFVALIISQSQAIANYIHHERSNFASKNGLPLRPVVKILSESWSTSFVKLVSRYAPSALTYIMARRWDTLLPTMPTMAATLQTRAENASDPHLTSKSAFFLFVQNFAEMQCFDRRDKIYGLTALLSAKDSFPIDYSIDIHELYFRAMQFFTSAEDISQEPCVFLVEDLASGLLDVLKISLSSLAKEDQKKRNTNYVLIPNTNNNNDGDGNNAVPDEDSSPPGSPRDVTEYFQTYENCISLAIGGAEHRSISCPRCSMTAAFDTATLLKIHKLQVATGALIGETGKCEFVGVLQCHVTDPKHAEGGKQSTHHSRADASLEHLLLYTHGSSGRPSALLDRKDREALGRLMDGLSPETLKAYIGYTKALSDSRPSIYTFAV